MDSVYKVVEIIGTSESSWEDAAKSALSTASNSLEDLRVAEVKELDLRLDDSGNPVFRAKLNISFKFRE